MIEKLDPPPGWGSEKLTDYLETAHRNRFATFVNLRSEVDRLIQIDSIFDDMLRGWVDPPNILEPLLLLRSHSSFRVACEDSMAGQISESFIAARSCLEYAAYAVLISAQPDLGELWLNRHEDETSRQRVVKSFKLSTLREAISARSAQAARIFQQLYDTAIDFGAHPNERAISGSGLIFESKGRKHIHQIYLHGDSFNLVFGLKNAARVGLCALEMANIVFPARLAQLNYAKRTEVLRREL